MLQPIFTELVGRYTEDEALILSFWNEIEKKYSGRKRYYHNLTHLQSMYDVLSGCKEEIHDWDIVLFSLFYHDIIYNVLRSDNEEKSAAMAVTKLRQLNITGDSIEKCRQLILATKAHSAATNTDIQFFTDADLSILGQPPEVYEAYSKQVRKEYSIYPDMVYKPGRKKVLEHFLGMRKIYQSAWFYNSYESTARLNLQKELEQL
jgi:predicted metal-dependent HD superfamily phosphohydrolase